LGPSFVRGGGGGGGGGGWPRSFQRGPDHDADLRAGNFQYLI